MRNNLKKGKVRVLIFKEKGTWYGAALEFNIVEAGSSPREVMLMLDEAIRGYIKVAVKNKLSVSVLNQKQMRNMKNSGILFRRISRSTLLIKFIVRVLSPFHRLP